MTYLYIPCKDEGQGESALLWSVYTTVGKAKQVIEMIDDNVEPTRWWLDIAERELWRNGDYYIDRVVMDELPPVI